MANVTCQSPNIINLIICNCGYHSDYAWYVGSTTDMQLRWKNHGSDFLLKKEKNVGFHSTLGNLILWSRRPPLSPFISFIFLESVMKETWLFEREQWWQSNLWTIFYGLNEKILEQSLCRNQDSVFNLFHQHIVFSYFMYFSTFYIRLQSPFFPLPPLPHNPRTRDIHLRS